MKINSIKDLIELLKDIGEPQLGYSRFFRGHSDQEWKLEPSIYRVPKKNAEKPFINNEDNIIRDAIVNSPNDFSNQDSIFSILVKLQHYGYPTRLLDLTTNVLVSLYFAVKSLDNKDGELFIFDIPNSEIKYFDSDTVSILSALSLRRENFRIDGYKSMSKINSQLDKLCMVTKLFVSNNIKISESDLNKIEQFSSYFKKDLMINRKIIGFNDNKVDELEKFVDGLIKKYPIDNLNLTLLSESAKKISIEIFNKQPDITRLLHDIRKDKPSFLPIIESKDLERVICVKPKLNNNRIIRQQGCFLLFGINISKANKAILDDKWLRKDNEGSRIIIPKASKQNILDELKVFGISEKTLFPELESQAKEILDKYK